MEALAAAGSKVSQGIRPASLEVVCGSYEAPTEYAPKARLCLKALALDCNTQPRDGGFTLIYSQAR
jgi:hypothetical protein